MKQINNKGFSLIEILVAMVLIGILSAIAIPAYDNYRNDANNTVLKSDAGTAYKGYHTFSAVNGDFCANLASAGLTGLTDSESYNTARQGYVGFGNTGTPTGCPSSVKAVDLHKDNGSTVTASSCLLTSDSFKFAVSNKRGNKIASFSVTNSRNSPLEESAFCHKNGDVSIKHASCTSTNCATAHACNGNTAGTWKAATSLCQ